MKIQNVGDINYDKVRKNQITGVSSSNAESFSVNTTSGWMYTREEDTLFTASRNIGDGNMYYYRGSYAEDSTEENPKIKIKYHYNNDKETKVKYVYPKQVDLTNATMDEYNCVRAYKEGKISGFEFPTTGGIMFYNSDKKHDFISLLEKETTNYTNAGIFDKALYFKKLFTKYKEYMENEFLMHSK